MRFSVDRAVRKVDQLLALARSETDATTLRLKSFDLAVPIGEQADTWVHRAITTQLDSGFDLRTAKLVGDPYLVRELLENLMDNALRHTSPGRHITVATASFGPLTGNDCRNLAGSDTALRYASVQYFSGRHAHVRIVPLTDGFEVAEGDQVYVKTTGCRDVLSR